MLTKEILIKYEELSSPEELCETEKGLVEAAVKAVGSSYAPYSHFNVGAAVLLDDGTVVTGSNQENAAYPSGLCAERTAMFSAGAQYPDRGIRCLAVAGGFDGVISDEPAAPCGACRQVMAQYQRKAGADMAVILIGARKLYRFSRVDDLLPMIFDNL